MRRSHLITFPGILVFGHFIWSCGAGHGHVDPIKMDPDRPMGPCDGILKDKLADCVKRAGEIRKEMNVTPQKNECTINEKIRVEHPEWFRAANRCPKGGGI